MEECKYKTEDGVCEKDIYRHPCKVPSLNWFDEPVEMVEVDEVCKCSSLWGNTYHYISKEEIELLLNGKVIYIDDGEYCHFIALKEEE